MATGDRVGVRLLVILALVGVQIGFLLQYGQHASRCPTPECLADDYDRYVGETIRLHARVESVSPPTIAIDYAPGKRLRLRVTDLSTPAQRGEILVVYGQLRPDHTIVARDVVRHSSINEYYMFAISALAIVGVTVLGLREWRFDTSSLVFRRRDR